MLIADGTSNFYFPEVSVYNISELELMFLNCFPFEINACKGTVCHSLRHPDYSALCARINARSQKLVSRQLGAVLLSDNISKTVFPGFWFSLSIELLVVMSQISIKLI